MFTYGLTSSACVLLKCEVSGSRKHTVQYNMNTINAFFIFIYHACMQVCRMWD